MPATATRSLIDELYQVPGKAEIVNGEIVHMSPTGVRPGKAGGEIYFSLRMYESDDDSNGSALPDNVGFIVDLPHRQSFCPDAAWLAGDFDGMEFAPCAPTFAAEVRSENDYGPRAEREMAAKRRDYFAAGTLVVWDVDLQGEDVILKYTSENPEEPIIFRRGDLADAEPAVPGWRMPVDALFPRRKSD